MNERLFRVANGHVPALNYHISYTFMISVGMASMWMDRNSVQQSVPGVSRWGSGYGRPICVNPFDVGVTA